MRTLSLYVMRELVGPIIAGGLFFTAVLLLAELLNRANALLRAGVGAGPLMELIGVLVVTLLTMTVPMAVLLGTLIAVGRLTAENEILAIRVAGIPLFRLFVPTLVAALLLAGGLAWMNSFVIPRMFQRIHTVMYEMQVQVLTNLRPGQFYDDLGSRDARMTLYFDKRLETNGEERAAGVLRMGGVNMRFLVEPSLVRTREKPQPQLEFLLFAREGLIAPDAAGNSLQLVLENGLWIPLEEENASQGSSTVMRFGRLESQLGSRQLEEAGDLNPAMLDLPDLWRRLQDPPALPVLRDGEVRGVWKRHFAMRNDLLRRMTLPLAVVAFVLIGIPLAIHIRPQAKAFALLIAMALMLIYYVLMSIGLSIAASGVGWTAAWAAAMMPNVLIGAVGAVLLVRATAA